MSALDRRLRAALDSRRARLILRSLDPEPAWASPDRPTESAGRPAKNTLLDFSSNDYLAFSSSPHLRHAFQERLFRSPDSPFGPASSRLLDGNTPVHRGLEADLTGFFLGRAGLLFNSGFDANVGLWSTLPGPADWVLYDALVHASVHDGLRASRTAPNQRIAFSHNSVDALEHSLRAILATDTALRDGEKSVFISVEALYSMDGDLCPLKEMADLVDSLFSTHRNAYLVVDEAHSTGLYGPAGRGLVCAMSLSERISIRLHTFGKAAACSGAIVLVPPLVRAYLINYARPLIFSTAMMRMNVLAIGAAVAELNSERRRLAVGRLEKLAGHLARLLRKLLTKHAITPLDNASPRPAHVPFTVPRTALIGPVGGLFSPIVPLFSAQPRALARFLYQNGFLVRPIGTPTVPSGRESVRVCLHADQRVEMIERLVAKLDLWIIKSCPQRPHL